MSDDKYYHMTLQENEASIAAKGLLVQLGCVTQGAKAEVDSPRGICEKGVYLQKELDHTLLVYCDLQLHLRNKTTYSYPVLWSRDQRETLERDHCLLFEVDKQCVDEIYGFITQFNKVCAYDLPDIYRAEVTIPAQCLTKLPPTEISKLQHARELFLSAID